MSRFLARDKRVVLGYLFGSVIGGHSGPLSDVDVAIYVKEKISLRERGRMMMTLVKLLGVPRVDLVLLNSASPVLKHEVIAYGKLIFCRDDDGIFRY